MKTKGDEVVVKVLRDAGTGRFLSRRRAKRLSRKRWTEERVHRLRYGHNGRKG